VNRGHGLEWSDGHVWRTEAHVQVCGRLSSPLHPPRWEAPPGAPHQLWVQTDSSIVLHPQADGKFKFAVIHPDGYVGWELGVEDRLMEHGVAELECTFDVLGQKVIHGCRPVDVAKPRLPPVRPTHRGSS
jgi:hypothetical protein